jgi:hypothetical protein
MKQLKSVKADGMTGFLPYNQKNIEALQSTNRNGNEKQRMSLYIVDVDEQGAEKIIETIYQIDKHKPAPVNHNPAKEIEFSEKELELQVREQKLKVLEQQLKVREERLKNKPVTA